MWRLDVGENHHDNVAECVIMGNVIAQGFIRPAASCRSDPVGRR
jgi:hypothetical protein